MRPIQVGKTIKGQPSKSALIKSALDRGVDSIEELCLAADSKPKDLLDHIRANGLETKLGFSYSELKPYLHWGEIDILIGQGVSIGKIASKIGVPYRKVWDYLHVSGQVNQFKEGLGQQKSVRRELVFLMNQYVDLEAKKQGWAYQKAIQYMRSIRVAQSKSIQEHYRGKHDWSKLVVLFQRYESAVDAGDKLSLEELTNGLDLSFAMAGRILKQVELEPLYGTRERNLTPKFKKESIRRVYYSEMTISDVAYFLDVSDSAVYSSFVQWFGAKKREVVHSLGNNNRDLPYRKASQIYEAHDTGFSPPETSFLLDAEPKVVQIALEKRNEFEPRIVRQLQIIFPDKEITKPYLTFKP